MSTELERIEAEALKLPVEARERLIKALIDSLDRIDGTTPSEFGGFASAEIQKSWLEEIDRRIQRIRDGQSQPVPVAEAFANIQERLESRDHANGATAGEFGGFATAELQKYWLDEAERRMHLIRSGQMKTFPVDEVMAEARAMLKAARENR